MTGVSSSCGACKFLRRRCTEECIFAPYFSYKQAANHFAAVHKVFGASNVSKLLSHLPEHSRSDAAITVSYEALARMEDPIYGCIAHIFALQQQVAILEEEIEMYGKAIANPGGYFSREWENEATMQTMMDPGTSDVISEGCVLERLLEQDYYIYQDNNLQSLWTRYAAQVHNLSLSGRERGIYVTVLFLFSYFVP
ncbi:LOB domain-containing protein 33-like [Salvia hispanica]|uniref:LOB domain-containing protein 33-like n=1 Tax=Salvia hispanica TaxID=49212 RepID=UPI002009889E|nr:LOB domain-containing protein 33-like [Salvia hispanica]